MAEHQRVQHAWGSVRVDHVGGRPCAAGRVVSAIIDLGGLVPVDVHVGLTEGGPADVSPCAPDERMWSCASLDNGCFVFERTIPPESVIAGSDWTISVRPADGEAGEPVMYPFRLST